MVLMHRILASCAFVALLSGCATNTAVEQTLSGKIAKLPSGVRPCALPVPKAPRLIEKPAGTSWFAPKPPVYPDFSDRRPVLAQAQCISDAFKQYVKAWMDGRVPAEIPAAFLPQGMNLADYPRFRLVRPQDITPEQQWAIRPAFESIDHKKLYGFFPDPNVSYIVIPALFAPFGTRVIVEGKFPYARFFDAQITPSFVPENYHYDAWAGVGEVPIVDADIEPLPGHTNPFRPGAVRTGSKRSYRLEFRLAAGDPVALNPAFRPPHFRSPGNVRYGGGIMYQGPWGNPGSPDGHKRGVWDSGQLWLRYYAPDHRRGPLAGVPLPKIYYMLEDGRKFYVAPDMGPFIARSNRTTDGGVNTFVPPAVDAAQGGPGGGWYKQTGIFRAILAGVAMGTGWGTKEYARLLDKGVTGRGSDLPPPNNYEQSATSATYVDYLSRGMSIEKGKVVVLTGKLPTFPQTRDGARVMQAAQLRYWSIVGYGVPAGWDFLWAFFNKNTIPGLATHAVMDDEVVLNKDRFYTIVMSRPEDRPNNSAPRNGVTWVNWGPYGSVSWTLRWLSVGPEWKAPFAPTPELLGRKPDWPDRAYDARAIGMNSHKGTLGPYLPKVHYMSREAFEKLGARVNPRKVPEWEATRKK
jgi:hypothetical protein